MVVPVWINRNKQQFEFDLRVNLLGAKKSKSYINMEVFFSKSIKLNIVSFQNSIITTWTSPIISSTSLDFVDITCQHIVTCMHDENNGL
jgi:hypothetical protein